MKKGWQTKKLADLVEVQNGYAFSSKDYSESGHFLMRIGNVQNGYISTADPKFIKLPADGSLQRFVLSEDDILVSLTGNVGRVGVIQESHLPAALNQRVARISIRKDSPATRELLLLFLCSDWFREELIGAGHGAAQQNVSTKDLVEIEIPVPPLAEQQRIVGLLDEAFAGLATAKANAEKNLQNARALFESHLQSVFTQRGQGWVETTLGEVIEIVGGSQPPKSVFSKTKKADNIRLIQIRDYKSDKHVVFIPRDQARRFCNADDVMIGRYGPPLFQILRGIEGAYNVALMKAVPDEAKLSRDFLFYFLKHSAILQYVIYHSSRAAGQIGVTKETLEPYPIALPSLAVQKTVVENIQELDTETQRLARLYQRKHAALEALKKSLLHQAFTGEL